MKFWNPFKRERRDAASIERIFGVQPSMSGQHVDAKAAEGLSAVFGCVQALSESVACLPLHVYARNADGRERADGHALARVLREPNDYQSGMAFRESMTATVLLHGNAFAKKEFNVAGEVTALHPLHPNRVAVVKLTSGRYALDVSRDDGKAERLLADEVFHLADRTEPGSILGKSRITVARETLGFGLALRTHGASTFKNGARPSGILESANKLSIEQQGNARELLTRFEGAMNAGKPMLLSNGFTFKPLSMNLEDAQFIAASQFNVEEVCRIFRVPPTIVSDLRHGNYSNTAELGSQFVRYSLARWLAMWETEISRSLLGPIARQRHFAEHAVDGLLRGNPEARAGFYETMIRAGVMLADEARRLENLPPLPNS
jgi:HK97 family phage portal protein